MTDLTSTPNVGTPADRKAPVLLLGFDAAEIDIVEHYIEAGKMPNLAALRERGFHGRLQTEPRQFLSIVWTTAFTSTGLDEHGWYFNKQWNPDRQYIQTPDLNWLPRTPFWDDLDEHYKVALFDVPYAVIPPHGDNQLALFGWQTHDDFGNVSKPAGLRKSMEDKFGKPALRPEVFGPQTAKTLLDLRTEILETNQQFSLIVNDFLTNFDRDLTFAVLGGIHRGTHYLWDSSQIDSSDTSPEDLQTLRGSLEDCYVSLDRTLGDIVSAASENTRIFTFALHGMGPNMGWYEYLPRIVERVHSGVDGNSPVKRGLLFRLKNALPWEWIRQVTTRIPHSWNKALLQLWTARMYDWTNTRYFTLPMDYNGFIRFNIKGREKKGCLNPADVEAEIDRLEQGLKSFRDIKTGKPIFEGVQRIETVIDKDSPVRHCLPDLVVTWAVDFPTSESCGISSDTYGEIRWTEGEKLDSGRSGNHTPHGWFVATGPGIEPGSSDQSYSSIDIVPTILQWMGARPNPRHKGKVIDALRVD